MKLSSGILWAGLLVLLVLSERTSAWVVNEWSAAYLDQRLGEGKTAVVLPPEPPQGHINARVWLAEDALIYHDIRMAKSLLEPTLYFANPFVYRAMGYVFQAEGDYATAVNFWMRSGDFQSLLQTAEQAKIEERFDEAELAYRGTWKLNPLDGTLPLVNFLRSDPDTLNEAISVIEWSLKNIDPNHPNWLRTLGILFQNQSKWDKAIDLYYQALEQDPLETYNLFLLGWAYYNGKHDIDSALFFFKRFVELKPDIPDGYLFIGQLMEKEQRYDEAEYWFTQAESRSR